MPSASHNSDMLTASLCGARTVSSTLRIRQAASVALLIALIFTRLGSQTNASRLLRMPSGPSTSTPNHFSPLACFMRNLLRISVESRPALSQICRGMTSSAFANAIITSCSFPGIDKACFRIRDERSSFPLDHERS